MATTFTKIASVELSTATSNIEFTSIPNTYTDLVLLCSLRTTNAVTYGVPLIRFNGATTDTGFTNRTLLVDNQSISNSTTSQGLVIRRCPSGNSAADYFGSATVWIYNYASTTTNKFLTGYMATPNNASAGSSIGIIGVAWADTTAISSLKILDDNAGNFAQYSSVYLYGISNS